MELQAAIIVASFATFPGVVSAESYLTFEIGQDSWESVRYRLSRQADFLRGQPNPLDAEVGHESLNASGYPPFEAFPGELMSSTFNFDHNAVLYQISLTALNVEQDQIEALEKKFRDRYQVIDQTKRQFQTQVIFDANPQDGSDTGVMVELDTFGGMYTIRYTHRERLQAFNDRIAEVEQKELKENDKALDEIM
ncbi:hypothetical protein RM531_08865 [Salinisphaera sp. P385]|uniref:Uncharacterized protein n=1 Tax=Spectribacter acetivorans TaxID=3075603 RepID=A0ABU3B7Y7_9GAMM|nr:hypothetical protein [Salinisphaera sp. P385]MDT0618589.1 hypothetical protein [Salinisphaera sp. P385]